MDINVKGYSGVVTNNYQSRTNEAKNKEDNVESNIENNEKIEQTLGKDTFIKSNENEINETYKPSVKKKLTTEEVNALKEQQANSEAELIKNFLKNTIKNQNNILGNTDNSVSSLSDNTKDLLTKVFGSIENAYPPIATTQEGAKAAISKGGAYSVNAVSDRIMKLAHAIAGDDPDKIQEMRDAVEKGFEQARKVFKGATNSELPQISKDTYTEIMNRFDKWQNKDNSETDNDENK